MPSAPPSASPAGPRKPRLLWAHAGCLLDTASGAALAVREMLLALVRAGFEVQVLGATEFDHERGTAGLRGQWGAVQSHQGGVTVLVDGPLEHRLLVTASTRRAAMSCAEESHWFGLYGRTLDAFRPDLVFYFGGQPLDLLIAAEARARGVPVAFYVANAEYTQSRWCRDVDLVLTNSHANADLYARRLGLRSVAIGPFIDPARVVAPRRDPRHILFVNPSLEKGAGVVMRLAMLLEQRRPDIVFEVVESRGTWSQLLLAMSTALGSARETLANVIVTENTPDMRPVYGRARLLLAPSLWWESMGRVLVEAMLNGIPAIITDCGGMPEIVQGAGIILQLDACFHEKPYTRVPPADALEPVLQRIEALFDDEAAYTQLSNAAQRVGQSYGPEASTGRLLNALQPLVALRAGDSDTGAALRKVHRHALDDRALPDPPSRAGAA